MKNIRSWTIILCATLVLSGCLSKRTVNAINTAQVAANKTCDGFIPSAITISQVVTAFFPTLSPVNAALAAVKKICDVLPKASGKESVRIRRGKMVPIIIDGKKIEVTGYYVY